MSVLFEHVTAVTMDEERRILKDAYVAVEGTRIASVGTQRPQGAFDRVIDGAGKVLMPGFVNAHTHLPMTLMRGYGGGQDLQHWLNDFIFPPRPSWTSGRWPPDRPGPGGDDRLGGHLCGRHVYEDGDHRPADRGGGHLRQPVLRGGVFRRPGGLLP